jgi:hypothetical protein
MGEKPINTPEVHTRAFQPWRVANSAKARNLVAEVTEELLAAELRDGTRQRARRPKDRVAFEATVGAIIADLVHLALSAAPHAPSRLTITRSRAILGRFSPRYRAPAFNAQLPAVLDALVALGYVGQSLGDRSGFAQVFTHKPNEKRTRQRTTVWPGPRLPREIERLGITFGDLQHAGGQTIILKAEAADYWSPALPTHYEETDETRRHRADMDRLNKWLARADLQLPGGPSQIDISDRYLRRIFTRGSFKRGGRLAGGWWMNLERHLRLSLLRIEGERVVSLDFSSLNPRLLYAMEDVEPAARDLYDVPCFEGYRDGAKRLLNALFFDTKQRASKPKRTPQDIAEGVELFPPAKSIAELITALAEAHGPIARHFGSGVGHHLQFLESTILVKVLLHLRRAGIVGLPVHDALIVRRSNAEEAKAKMMELAREVVGMEIPITLEEAD